MRKLVKGVREKDGGKKKLDYFGVGGSVETQIALTFELKKASGVYFAFDVFETRFGTTFHVHDAPY